MITVKWQQRSDLLNISKPTSGKLQEHFGFKLLADHNIKNADQVYCILNDNHFHTMDLTGRELTTLKKYSLQYSKLQLAKSASFNKLINALQKF